MNFTLILTNLLNPPILFFFLGVLAVWLGSDLDIPQPLPKFFSLYLLLSIGFKGGVELNHSGADGKVLLTFLIAIGVAVLVPLYVYSLLRRRLGPANAAAVAATYGSVSAVTFIAATSLLQKLQIPFGGYMVAMLAVMESPAIVVGVLLYRLSQRQESTQQEPWRVLLQEAFFNGSVFVLVGSLLIGFLTGKEGELALKPFVGDIFKGILCLFLLDMGLVSGRRVGDLKRLGGFVLGVATLVPLCNAGLGIVIALLLRLEPGNAFLFCTLCASASYIAVPAAMRLAIPEANPGIFITMALALTFPFHILFGLPLYLAIIQALWR